MHLCCVDHVLVVRHPELRLWVCLRIHYVSKRKNTSRRWCPPHRALQASILGASGHRPLDTTRQYQIVYKKYEFAPMACSKTWKRQNLSARNKSMLTNEKWMAKKMHKQKAETIPLSRWLHIFTNYPRVFFFRGTFLFSMASSDFLK